jgi:hypothetical protein
VSARTALLSVAAFALAASASAQLKPPPSPEGDWTFATENMRVDCVLKGEMNIKKVSENAFSCAFEAEWSCKTGPERKIVTKQICKAAQTGTAIAIASTIEKVVKVEPASRFTFMDENYMPDHFSVTINPRGSEMDGIFKSFDTARVKFRRKLGDLVS